MDEILSVFHPSLIMETEVAEEITGRVREEADGAVTTVRQVCEDTERRADRV